MMLTFSSLVGDPVYNPGHEVFSVNFMKSWKLISSKLEISHVSYAWHLFFLKRHRIDSFNKIHLCNHKSLVVWLLGVKCKQRNIRGHEVAIVM